MAYLIRLADMRAGYVRLVRQVADDGHPVVVRGLPTRELTGVTLVFPPEYGPMLPVGVNRGVNVKLATVEALAVLASVHVADLIDLVAPRYGDVLLDPGNVGYGAYGPRIGFDQFDTVVRLLRDDPSSRQAVLTIWNRDDLAHVGDKPCTLTLQLLLRDDRLELHVTMRSQDAWLGAAYDMFTFSQVQQTIARVLDVGIGQYVHHVGSLHLYERDLPFVDGLRDPTRSGQAERTSAPGDDLPHGVVWHDDHEGSWSVASLTATLLLTDGQNVVAELNPWYAGQMDRVSAARRLKTRT